MSGEIDFLAAGAHAERIQSVLAPLGRCEAASGELASLQSLSRFELLAVDAPFMARSARQIFAFCHRHQAAVLVLGLEPAPEWLADSIAGACDWDLVAVDAPDVLIRARALRLLGLRRVRQRLREQSDALRRQEDHSLRVGDMMHAAAGAESLQQVLRILADYAREISGARSALARLFPGHTVMRTLEASSPPLAGMASTSPVLVNHASQPHTSAPHERRLSLPLRSRQGHTLGVVTLSLAADAESQGARLESFAAVAGMLLESAALAGARRGTHPRDEFLATLSHELRTPLTSILAWTRLLRAGRLDSAAASHGLEVVERNVRAQAQVVEDLLDVSQMVSGVLQLKFEPLDLAACAESAIASLRPQAQARQIRLTAVLDPSAHMLGDPLRLRQVAWNLLSNAIKFTPAGGAVAIRLERQNGRLRLSVADTGPGVKPEFLPHLFEHFHQLEDAAARGSGGLGLGLAIVKNLVERHGGTVSAHNVPPGSGGGARFVAEFPAFAVAPERFSSPHSSSLEDGLQGLRVLLVEDDAAARERLVRLLREFNCAVQTAGSGREALALLDASVPDVLIGDINMPGQDGLQLIHLIRSRRPESGGSVPAIALASCSTPEEIERCLEHGFQMHLSKPAAPATLAHALASLCGRVQDKPAIATVA